MAENELATMPVRMADKEILRRLCETDRRGLADEFTIILAAYLEIRGLSAWLEVDDAAD